MKKCKNEVLMDKIGIKKLTKETEFAFTVLENLPDCKKIDTKKKVDVTYEGEAADPTYNRFAIPPNSFECEREGCVNSGTLYPNGEGTVIYRVAEDATEFAAGVIVFYVAGTFTSAEVTIGNERALTNADKYTATKGIAKDGYTPVIVDLSKEGTTIGTGWTPSASGAYIGIKVNAANYNGVGISSISIYDSMEDFAINNVVIVGCITNEAMDIAIEAAEASCFSSGYDDSSEPELEMTLEGNSVTPNYYLLNPLNGKGEATTGFDRATIQKTIASGDGYGTVTLTDAYQDECGYLTAALANGCDITESQLVRLSIPALVDIDEKHYLVIPQEDGTTMLYFNSALIGQDVIISYPKEVEVEERVDSMDNLGNVRVRAYQTTYNTDGSKVVYLYDNVLVTSFPHTITEEETSFSFTLRFQKDGKGRIRRIHRIIA